jgi:hypothetical protein
MNMYTDPETALKRYYSFESSQEFEAFEAILTQQLATGQLLPASTPPAVGFLPYLPDACYQLSGSSELWVLSTPDNAWRGFFLPLAHALAHQKQLRSRDERIRLIGLLALVALGFIAWHLVK